MALAGRIRTLRAAAGLSQEELGRLLGTSQRVISTWEVGRSDVPASELPQLARVLGVASIDDLFVERGAKPANIALAQKLTEALKTTPERIEVNVYVGRGSKSESARADRQPNSDSELSEPPPGTRTARQILDQWSSMSEQERQEWRELAEAIREQDRAS